MDEKLLKEVRHLARKFRVCLYLMALACLVGVVVGLIGSVFAAALSAVTSFRQNNFWVLFFLPFAGVVIVALYRTAKLYKDPGTNRVVSSLNADGHIPGSMSVIIFASTLLTHLCGGSAGREGAALQMGGSLGSTIARLLKRDEKTTRILIMCGMSAAFAAVFGTPMAAAVFSLEVASVGVMQYSGLLPCVIAAVIAASIAGGMGISPESFALTEVPGLTLSGGIGIAILAILCAGISTLFVLVLHGTGKLYKRFFPSPYMRVFAGGCIIIVLTLLVGNTNYNGAGIGLIEEAVEGHSIFWGAFLLKMLFTALTLEAGFKGGEIVPSFCIGATFGSLFGVLVGTAFGLPSGFCAAIGMAAVFCGVTNCPMTTLLISFELFGFQGIPYFLLAVAAAYTFSGYRGLYGTQIIAHSKYGLRDIYRRVGDEDAADELEE